MGRLSPRFAPTEEPRRRDAIAAAVGFAAEISMRAGSLDEVLRETLARLGRAVEASRSYIFRNVVGDRGALMMDEIAEWCAPGIAGTMDDPENHDLPYAPEHAHYLDDLAAGRPIVMARSTATGPDLADLEHEDIRSSVFVPVFLRDEWWGYLGFDDCVEERAWSQAEVDALDAAAGIIGVTIARLETNARLETATAPRFKTLVEKIPAITYIDVVSDPDEYPYPTMYMSPQIEAVLGFPPSAFVDDPDFWDRHIHPDDLSRIKEEDLANWSAERFESEYRMIAADGRAVWMHDEAERVAHTPDGREVWHGVMYDITALKEEAEREREAVLKLRALDEMKDTFLDAVSHELRTPVAAIMGLALTLERDEGGLTDAEKKDFAARISRNANKLHRLIRDLLDMSRLNRGFTDLDRLPTDVERIALRALEEAEMPVTHPVALDVEPVEAEVDASKIERIIENLLSNAVRHTPAGTRVTLAVHPVDDDVLIRVDDDGPGVRVEMREKIFEPFRQAAANPSEGAGIGLSLVARFTQLHGGRAWVEERPGGGASFRVQLPRFVPRDQTADGAP